MTHFGAPVEDATVSIDSGTETETDERGAYELILDNDELGERVLEVSADGYTSETRTVEVSAGETITIDVSLDRKWGPNKGELEVFVTQVGGGSTIPCHVTIYGDEEYDVRAPRGSVPDDVEWQRGFVVNEGWWEIHVSNADGYADGYEEVYVEAGDDTLGWVELTEGENEIPKTGQVDGTVEDVHGTAIAEATITVDDHPTAVTDENGAFDLELGHGTHTVEIEADGYESASGDVDVKFARTSALSVTLDSQR